MIGRRDFFRLLVSDVVEAFEEATGKPNFSLGNLGNAPRDCLEGIIPILAEAAQMTSADGYVCVSNACADQPIHRVSHESLEASVLTRFDGTTTLLTISSDLSRMWGVPAEEAFAITRKVFLTLVRMKLCVPANAPPGADGGR